MIRAVLFDRDGTLIQDGGNAGNRIVPMPHAQRALQRLRERGLRIGVVTNQPFLSRGDITADELAQTHACVERLVGAIDGWFVCPHEPHAACACRKPAPGLVHAAARVFDVLPHECVVVGDIGSDVEAARQAGALAVLVPTPVTRAAEIAAAPVVCENLTAAVDYILPLAASPAA